MLTWTCSIALPLLGEARINGVNELLVRGWIVIRSVSARLCCVGLRAYDAARIRSAAITNTGAATYALRTSSIALHSRQLR
jgi:hypothetical protein